MFLRNNQIEKKYGTTKSNMSTVVNKGVKMRCEAVTEKLFIVVGIRIEPGTSIEKPKGSPEACIYIR